MGFPDKRYAQKGKPIFFIKAKKPVYASHI